MVRWIGLVGGLMLAGCSGDPGYADYTGDGADEADSFGTSSEAVAACVGDSLQYDYNAFAASLAVAAANELGQWDTANNFVVSNGKLALSSAASSACGAGCPSLKDMLLLQDDATANKIPNHSPSEYRSHLVSWYNSNMARLTELATESKLPPGSYQFKNKNSNKYLMVRGSSKNDGAVIEQNSLSGSAGNWVASASGTKFKFMNSNSGKCMDLASPSSADNVVIVQKTCSSANTQLFDLVKQDNGMVALKTTYGKQVVVYNWGTSNGVQMVQMPYQQYNTNGSWIVNPVGSGSNPATTIFKGMYKLQFANTYSLARDLNLVAAPVSAAEGAQVKLASYSASNRLHNWYATIVNGKYQFINRGSGKCLALASDSRTAVLVQKTCAVNDSQLFTPTAQQYAEEYTLKTRYGTILEVQGSQTIPGAPITQTSTTNGDPQRRIRFSPIMAAEPHQLTFNHASHDGPCGDYFWYDIKQPSGAPVSDPLNTYIDLIFAGGKTTYNGADANPFIAQQSSGTQVAIDPSGYMVGGTTSTSGSCIQSDIYSDPTKAIAGTCCIKYSGVQGTFKASSWSTTMFLCQ